MILLFANQKEKKYIENQIKKNSNHLKINNLRHTSMSGLKNIFVLKIRMFYQFLILKKYILRPLQNITPKKQVKI